MLLLLDASLLSRCYWLLLLLVLTEYSVGKQVTHVSPVTPVTTVTQACQTAVCNRVAIEVEGLARVKMLRGYVTETVSIFLTLYNINVYQNQNDIHEMKTYLY